MADSTATKKYLDYTGLQYLVGKIDTEIEDATDAIEEDNITALFAEE